MRAERKKHWVDRAEQFKRVLQDDNPTVDECYRIRREVDDVIDEIRSDKEQERYKQQAGGYPSTAVGIVR